MRVTDHIHALRIPFKIPISPEKVLEREVYSYLVFTDTITLIDSGVAGAQQLIFDYIKEQGRNPWDISLLILTHSHPDHIGSVRTIKEATKCGIAAHRGERAWIEDTDQQFADRPVPGFHTLVAGPVAVDRLLAAGDVVELGAGVTCSVMHTPGHSSGSISLVFPSEKVLITGDAVPLPNDLPIYEDIVAVVDSINQLKKMIDIDVMLSSWEAPILGPERIGKRINEALSYLRRIHETVQRVSAHGQHDLPGLCREVVRELGLPPFAANPLVAKSFAASLGVAGSDILF